MRTRVKFCGTTSLLDAKLAIDAGADAVGLIFAESPRQITFDVAEDVVAALPPFVTPVGVFVDPEDEELGKIQRALPGLLFQISRTQDDRPESSRVSGIRHRIEVISVPRVSHDIEAIGRMAMN